LLLSPQFHAAVTSLLLSAGAPAVQQSIIIIIVDIRSICSGRRLAAANRPPNAARPSDGTDERES